VSDRIPQLVVFLRLEEPGVIVLDAASYEDEIRLRTWLRRSRQLETLPDMLGRLLDDLDERDREEAA
jgi:hypothetical protein